MYDAVSGAYCYSGTTILKGKLRMRRRELIAGLGSAAALPVVGWAQQAALPIIGFLHNQSLESMRDTMAPFSQGLAETGFVEGRNVTVDHRWAEGQTERRRALLADLVRRQVSLIVTDTTNGGTDAKAATQVIPIIFMAGADPVEFGLVSSLSRPGGNATGLAMQGIEVTTKRLDLLHKLVPAAAPIAMFIATPNATDPVGRRFGETEARDFQSAASRLGLSVVIINVTAEGSIEAAFKKIVELRAGALLLGANILWRQERMQIALLAVRYAVPTMFWESTAVQAGALASYGPDFLDADRQVGVYAGRILKGEKPADLPVIQPTKFEFVLRAPRTIAVLSSDLLAPRCDGHFCS
jgi:putative tryptophan/tyrosine transport system substrate-binding protein